MILKKAFFAIVAVCAFSVAGFAADNSDNDTPKCRPGQPCSMKSQGAVMSGEHPIVMEPQDKCKGTVQSVSRVQYPDGSRTHMMISNEDGDQKVVTHSQRMMPYQPGDRVEVTGRCMYVNGEKVMVADHVHKHGSVAPNLNNSVRH